MRVPTGSTLSRSAQGLVVWAALVATLLGAVVASAASTKVQICHRPPDDPSNYQTITVSETALPAHLAHGDYAEACESACANLCDDGNLCTSDAGSFDPTTDRCICSHEPVNCDDTNACTTDTCDPAQGCVNIPVVGAACDDGQACTGPDICDASGTCTGPPIAGCCLSDAQCVPADLCHTGSCNPATHTCAFSSKECTPPGTCYVSACNPATGSCENALTDCNDGKPETEDFCLLNTADCVHWNKDTSPQFFPGAGYGNGGYVCDGLLIWDPAGRIQAGDIAVLYLPHTDPAGGVIIEDNHVIDQYNIGGRVPHVPVATYYAAVLSATRSSVRFTGTQLNFNVLPDPPYYPPTPELCQDLAAGGIITPTQGSVGTQITIDDPLCRIQPGDIAVFHLPGDDPAQQGFALTNIQVHGSGCLMTGSAPNIPSGLQYWVAVLSADRKVIRFPRPLAFFLST